jgi:large subunit ribosomal protein L25
MPAFNLAAQVRTDNGKGASRRLRHAKMVPAIIYGGKEEPQSIALELRHVMKAQESEEFYSKLLKVTVDGNEVEVVLKAMQRHPAKNHVMHLDFMRVDPTHKLHKTVPLHFVNENKNPALKAGGVLTHLANDLDVTCLPADLPTFIEVDVADLEVGHSLHISDLKLPAGVSSVELTKGDDHDHALANIQVPRGAASSDAEEAAE